MVKQIYQSPFYKMGLPKKNQINVSGFSAENNKPAIPALLPLVKGGDKPFDLILTEELLKKIKYLCMRFPTVEWSGVLFYDFEGDIDNITELKITAFDLYPLDIGTSTYTEFMHSPDFAGYIAKNPDLMNSSQGLIHSHNTMSTFFSGTDSDTLREMAPIYGNYLSLIVNNAGTYTAGLAIKSKIIKNIYSVINYKGLDYKEKTINKGQTEVLEEVILKFDAIIIKDSVEEGEEEFVETVHELEKRVKERDSNKQIFPKDNFTGFSSKTINTDRNKFYQPTLFPEKEISSIKPDLRKETINFLTKLITQSYFYVPGEGTVPQIERAVKFIPKNLNKRTYETMIYEFIEPLFIYLEIDFEEDKAFIIQNSLDVLSGCGEFDYREEIEQILKEYLEEITEEIIADEELISDGQGNLINQHHK